jgi:hypothetical protein
MILPFAFYVVVLRGKGFEIWSGETVLGILCAQANDP